MICCNRRLNLLVNDSVVKYISIYQYKIKENANIMTVKDDDKRCTQRQQGLTNAKATDSKVRSSKVKVKVKF